MLSACGGRDVVKIDKPTLLLPAGRPVPGATEIQVSLNNSVIPAEDLADADGGHWLKIATQDLPSSGAITIRYKRMAGPLSLYKEPSKERQRWLAESRYIDCSDGAIKAKAAELTVGVETDIDKARRIQEFVIGYVQLDTQRSNSYLEKASQTYSVQKGTCMNFSRLFVALARAAGVPARTVWGIVYGHEDDGIYDYHHQWAEALGQDGCWHPMDFNYTTSYDLNDIRYLDLLYAAEENAVLRSRGSVQIELGDVEFFDDYPAPTSGKLGFELLEDRRPESMTVRYAFRFTR